MDRRSANITVGVWSTMLAGKDSRALSRLRSARCAQLSTSESSMMSASSLVRIIATSRSWKSKSRAQVSAREIRSAGSVSNSACLALPKEAESMTSDQ